MPDSTALSIRELVLEIRSDVKRLNNLVCGNGHKGINERVRDLEHLHERVAERGRWFNRAIFVALFGLIAKAGYDIFLGCLK